MPTFTYNIPMLVQRCTKCGSLLHKKKKNEFYKITEIRSPFIRCKHCTTFNKYSCYAEWLTLNEYQRRQFLIEGCGGLVVLFTIIFLILLGGLMTPLFIFGIIDESVVSSNILLIPSLIISIIVAYQIGSRMQYKIKFKEYSIAIASSIERTQDLEYRKLL